jgi:dihydroorotase
MTRRKMLADVTGSLALSAAVRGGARAAPSGRSGSRLPEDEKSYDLLIAGGRVIDPAEKLDAKRDVAIRGGKIAAVEPQIPPSQAREVIDAKGKIVTPGLIDLHTHVFPYVGPYGIEPDPYCVARGVTTVVDAGTSGALTFAAFRRYIIERAATRVRALLHVVSIGMVAGSTPNMGELEDLRYAEPKMAVKVAGENRDVIVGFKIRFSKQYTGTNDLEGMRRARVTADEARLPLMIHIGGSYTPLEQFLTLMKKGDVVTHSFNAHPHGLLASDGKLLPEVIEARQRGVLFDVGHGAGSFSFEVMEKCLGQGFAPDTISSDLYTANIAGPVYDLPTTLAKFLLLGMSLGDVVERATVNASRLFNFGADIGTLKPGLEADVSVFELREGQFTFTDSEAKTRTGRQRLLPVTTVRGGKVFRA